MRSTVTFLIGCVIGATGILLYLQATHRLVAPAAEQRSLPAVLPAGPAAARVGPATALVSPPFVGGPLIIPVRGVAASTLRPTFNEARAGHLHGAIDILAPRGTPVVAAVPGEIRKLFISAAGGLTIYQFDAEERNVYYYAHLDRYADGLREGLRVPAGEVIGYVGTSGNAAPDTPHLHFAVAVLPPTKEWWKGEPVDPYPLLVSHSLAAAQNVAR